MNLIRFALRKPISILVLVAGILFFGIGSVRDIKVDILPKMDLPVIYISQPFGGYTPDQMEAYFTKNYASVLLLANGIKSIETKNLQGLSLLKLTYHEGTNMAQAAGELTALVNRVQVAFPPSSQPPYVVRFDASSLPVGQLVLKSKTRSNNELQELANNYVRSSFTSIQGLTAPQAFGGSSRTIEINVDPARLRAHNLTADQLVQAIRLNNQTAPSGNVRIGDLNYMTPTNTSIKVLEQFAEIPLFKGEVANVRLGDVATIKDGADLSTGYALVDGKRSVYISIAKAADASTWEVVKNLKASLAKIQNSLPEDVEVSYEFDQSVYVINSVKTLVTEGAIGAILTGLMVILFLGDRRAALIVILTIPISVIAGVFFLKLFGFTINLMTLSGLALSIGILVDESTVTIENIHQHLDMGKSKARAIVDACLEIALPKLLILLCILAMFAPAITMSGMAGALFLPLSLAIGFSMITSFLLSQTFVPVMANWLMKTHKKETENKEPNKPNRFEKVKVSFVRLLDKLMAVRKIATIGYFIIITGIAALLITTIGRDVMPKVNSSQFQLRVRAPEGTRMERTEEITKDILRIINETVGEQHVGISSAFAGTHPASSSTSPIYLFMSGSHEAVLRVALKDYRVDMDDFKDKLREQILKAHPNLNLYFEQIDLTDKILGKGSPTPIEVRVAGRDKKVNKEYADKLIALLEKDNTFRDLQTLQSTNYPAMDININRTRAAELGVDMSEISRSLVASTSSSRYTEKNIWLDEKWGFAFNVQVQIPPDKMGNISQLGQIPLRNNSLRPVLGDVATLTPTTVNGQTDNIGVMPYLSVIANLHHKDLGTASKAVEKAIAELGELPRGLTIQQVGLTEVLDETLSSLQGGLLVAVVVIFLMLAANFQSFKVSFTVLSAVPAVVLGSLLLLLATGSTLNLQSAMGIILSVGVSIANAVLLITNAETLRRNNGDAIKSAKEAASVRLRPIIMTSIAMIAGMLPMAIGHGEAGEQTAPLGRAVIGGLIFSTIAVLIILPLVFAWVQGKSKTQSVSLDPDDKDSTYYEPLTEQ
ncbi:efflux RND transporter permease subunit [Chryseobacterium sp. POL2]|uniref:efflux RND transporter permease subunit n=1 Tax=Chryseobacterium sp. POL2 TaxID=2713414 RepID=UPI0013E104DE|nr:efflux RND transporter permease subunit [Chryseobacterium sp. POL2]QIG89701.1 efflux RND transporter permease subunit [Chryseobacterium sp. POL2]